MAEEDKSQKTEEPTSKKRAEARKKGDVASSMEIRSWAILMGATGAIMGLSPWIAGNIKGTIFKFLESGYAIPFNFEHLRFMMAELLIDLGIILSPFFAILIVVALIASIGQTGFIWAAEKVQPKGSNLSLIKGAQRVFGKRSAVEFIKGILKIVVVSLVAFGLTLPLLDDITLIPFQELGEVLGRLKAIAIQLFAGTVAVMTVIALLDFAFQKYTTHQQLKMTKQEVKDENKQAEGDPQIKARIRQLRMERAQQRMMAAVPEADVVITNPTHYAVALKYKMKDMAAPILVAKGMDSLAQRIREVADENDIPIVENPPLARALYAVVELDQEIPDEHYKAVAEIIGYVMRLRGELPPI